MSRVSPDQVLARRRADRRALLDRAERFAAGLDERLGVRAVVVFGSVARGDFHETSDVDLLVVAADLPTRALERNAAVGIPPPRVEFVAWTPEEWRRERERGNPIVHDVERAGVWLVGSPDEIT